MHVDAEGRSEVALACEGRAIEDGVLFPGQGLVVVVEELFDATWRLRMMPRPARKRSRSR